MCLDFCRPRSHSITRTALTRVVTPLVANAWEEALAPHPDHAFTRYIIQGLQAGFRIGFRYPSLLRSATANMPSARQHPHIIDEYIAKERALGRFLGPFSSLPYVHVSRFGVIPKGHNTGKWRLITDLSFPEGASVNDGIDPSLCSLSYTTVEEVAALIVKLGRGALLAKVDIEAAYRLIPVHPDDRWLLAVRWGDSVYVDPMLLRSAPKIFNAVADALIWCLRKSGISSIEHYLDDFIIVAPPNSRRCASDLRTLVSVCETLGVPLATHKTEGPTTCLSFLGIELDTVAGELRLPTGKLHRLQALLQEWEPRKVCTRKDLESLIGLLNHACKVVRSGRSFLRRMLDLLHSQHRPPHSQVPIRLNQGFRSDLAWWQLFIQDWNGVSFLDPPPLLPRVVVTSDASGSWGCGAWHLQSWFQVPWDGRARHLSIAAKELVPIILACAVWGPSWWGHQVCCQCDNQVVTAALHARTSRDNGVMHLLRCLVFVEARCHCHLYPSYINTKHNHLADDLSRNNHHSFLLKVPNAHSEPSPVPHDLLDLLLDPQADWTSPRWRRLFNCTFRKA